MVEEARSRDYDVVLVTFDEGPKVLERLAKRRVADAFVLMDIQAEDSRLGTASALGLPVVLFGRPTDAHGLDAVDFDTRSAAELLVDHLADTGHRYVVAVGDPNDLHGREMRFIQDFYGGAHQRAAERGLDLEVVLREREGWAGIEQIADRVLARSGERLGLIARTPRVTEWLVQLARLRGLRLGRDISLVSLCTDLNATSFDPPITNVSPRPREFSRLAMRVLFDRIEGGGGGARLELVKPRPVTRRISTTSFD